VAFLPSKSAVAAFLPVRVTPIRDSGALEREV
jgi:hypothetical protein